MNQFTEVQVLAEMERLTARADRAEGAVKLLATALDNLGARLYRDINPDSSYQDFGNPLVEKLLSDFTAYAEECLTALDDPGVRGILSKRIEEI